MKFSWTLGRNKFVFHSFITMLASVCAFSVSKAQTSSSVGVVPKSPEAAAFDRIKDIPVNLYRGTLDFSIPLYTITDGDLSLPMSLDYQGSAIRVDQEATWVGLNWLLNVGGVITCRVSAETAETNGAICDPCTDPIATHGDSICNSYIRDWKRALEQPFGYVCPFIDGEFGIEYKFDGMQPNQSRHGANWFDGYTVLNNDHSTFRHSSVDPAPIVYGDIFHYHNGEAPVYHAVFMGHNITFVWDKIKKDFFITGNNNGYKIQGSRIGDITITDKLGIKYYFSCAELTYPTGTDEPRHRIYDETLYLSMIESPTGHKISLNYIDEGVYWPTRHVTETVYDNLYNSQAPLSSPNTDIYEQSVGQSYRLQRRVSPYYEISKKRLRSIRTNGLVVYFNALTNREDLNLRYNVFGTNPQSSVKRLDNISIYTIRNGVESLLKKYHFTYAYFAKCTVGGNTLLDMRQDETSPGYDPIYPDNDDFMYKRLKLESLWESDKDGNRLPSYEFTYYTEHTLPCKNSAAQDYWGFYNGQENYNGNYHSLIPKSFGTTTDNMAPFYTTQRFPSSLGVDRRSNIDYVYSCMLKDVLYPSGARVSFKYEQNSFSNMKYETMKATKDNYSSSVNQMFSQHRDEPTLGYATTISNIYKSSLSTYDTNSESCQPPFNRNSQFFLIEKPDSVTLEVAYCKNGPYANWSAFMSITSCLFEYTMERNPSGQYYEHIKRLVVNLRPIDSDTLGTALTISKKVKVWLEPGRYELKATGLSNLPTDKQFYQTTITAQATKHNTQLCYGNGTRIASITYYKNDSITTTRYKYGEDEFSTSGIMSSPVIFSREKLLIRGCDDLMPDGSTLRPAKTIYKVASSNNLTPNTPLIGYGWVKEEKISNNVSNGYRINEFWNKRWGNSDMWDYMVRIEDPRNGFLKAEYNYDRKHDLLSSIHNSFTLSKLESRWLSIVAENTYIGKNGMTSSNVGNENDDQYIGLSLYNPWYLAADCGIMDIHIYPSVQFGLNNTKKTVLQIENGDTIQQTFWTTYDPNSGLVTSEKKSTSIPGVYECMNYQYPKDYSNVAWIETLRQKHIIGVPISEASHTITENADKLVSSVLSKYNSWGQLSDKYYLNSNATISYSNFLTNYGNTFNVNGYENRQHIDYCDLTHNIRTVTENSCLKTTYIWGYKNKYPVAMIQGTDSTSIGNLLNCSLSTYESREEIDHLDLYNRLKVIPGASVTTFSYAPFIGMTGCIKPNGLNFTYEYDGFLRLNRIKRNDETINNYYYYYKRQQ